MFIYIKKSDRNILFLTNKFVNKIGTKNINKTKKNIVVFPKLISPFV